MVYEILVDGKTIFRFAKLHPVRLMVDGAVTLLQEDNVRNNFRASIFLERIIGQTDGTQQISTFGDVFTGRAVFTVQRVTAGDKGHDAARTHLVNGFGKEIVVDAEIQLVVRLVVDLVLAERHISYGKVIEIAAVSGFKSSNFNVGFRVELLGDTARDTVQFHSV